MSRIPRMREKNQRGMVSILVTMLLLIVVSLIVLGFAQIARRNQRQSLDRQLSTQAFYAAETGINDVRDIIRQNVNNGVSVVTKSDCDATSVAAYAPPVLNPTVDAANNISYSCVMVDPTPDTLVYTDIGPQSTIIPITAVGGTIGRVNLTWQSKDGTTTPITGCPTTTSGVFSPTTTWTCGYGVLRFDLVPTTGALTAAGLRAATMTSFVVPQSSGGIGSYGYQTNGSNDAIRGLCTNSGCSLTITGLASTQYYMRISSLYKDVSLQVTIADAAGGSLDIAGAQAVIDATGRAQDVLRRVQVHIPLTASSTNQLPDQAIQTTDSVCKRFIAMDGFFQSMAKNALATLTSMTVPPNPLCN